MLCPQTNTERSSWFPHGEPVGLLPRSQDLGHEALWERGQQRPAPWAPRPLLWRGGAPPLISSRTSARMEPQVLGRPVPGQERELATFDLVPALQWVLPRSRSPDSCLGARAYG